jgi:hypothetical protein
MRFTKRPKESRSFLKKALLKTPQKIQSEPQRVKTETTLDSGSRYVNPDTKPAPVGLGDELFVIVTPSVVK